MDCDGVRGNATKPISNPMFKNGLHYKSLGLSVKSIIYRRHCIRSVFMCWI